MTWDKVKITQALQTNDKVVERAILAIYNLQTLDEQNSSETKHRNGVGFSGAHASLGTYYAKWLKSGRSLTGVHLEKARKMALHYVGQLESLAKEKSRSLIEGRLETVSLSFCLRMAYALHIATLVPRRQSPPSYNHNPI